MREANWDEIFQRRTEEQAPAEDRLNTFLPWEDWLTFVIAAVCFLSVVASIDGAHWVNDMPSLYPIGASALLGGYLLSRVRRNELLLHPLALLAGASLVLLQLMAVVPGGTPAARMDNLLDRMYRWWSAVTQGGISSDPLPFIVLLLVVTWLGTYLSSWAIFRWRNAWLGLIPGGSALMWNISFIPGQFSYAFVVFVFGAVLLIMRMHVAHKEREWEHGGIAYPEFISLSTLNATFWITLGLLVFAYVLPLADRSESANQRWQDFTSPYTRHLAPLARVFVSVNAKKPITIHNLEDTLPFQGKISLSGKDAVTVDVKLTPEMAAFLRAQSFDEYTPDGWKVNVTGDVALPSGTRTESTDATTPGTRREVTINIKVEGGNNGALFSVGQPVEASRDAEVRIGAAPQDVQGLKPGDHLRNGDEYQVTGSVNVASIDQLEAAGTNYPDWVKPRYVELYASLPGRVGVKAREVTRGLTTPYDQAAAIEKYLRTFPVDYNVPSTPAGHDSVDFFLFDTQRGYFDYHASAMAVMLRTLGVPARVATGYVVDPLRRDGESDTFSLTERQAFAWPEVYFPGIGWVEFSPTPSQPLIKRPGTPADAPVPRASGERGLVDEPALDFAGLTGPPEVPAAGATGGGSRSWLPLALLAVAGGVLLAGAAGAKFAWEYGMGGMTRPAQLWEKTLRLASLGKLRARPSETPREFALRVARSVPDAGAATYVAASFERSRFGRKQMSEDEAERLESAWSALRASLLRRVLRLRPRSGE